MLHRAVSLHFAVGVTVTKMVSDSMVYKELSYYVKT